MADQNDSNGLILFDIICVHLISPGIHRFPLRPQHRRDLIMTLFQFLMLFVLYYLIYNVRRNNQRIRKLKQDVAQLQEKLKTEDG